MESNETLNEILTIFLAALIMAISVSIFDKSIFLAALVSMTIILGLNVLTKKLIAYNFEITTKTKFWSMYHTGLKKNQHLKKPLNMAWLPILTSLISKGFFLWFGILEFDAKPKAERASKRHGMYRFTELTERHLGMIALFGVLINIIAGLVGYIAGFELFARLNIYYAMWSAIPISRLDGTKIVFASRVIWTGIFAITSILFLLSFAII